MLAQEAVADHLVHHALVEAGRVQVGRLPFLQQLREDRPLAPRRSPGRSPGASTLEKEPR